MAKEKVLTELQKAFISAILGEAKGDFKLAKKLAGYSDSTPVQDIVKSLKSELREAAMDALTMASIKASFRLEDVLNDPNQPGTSNILKAADSILDRVGAKTSDDVIKAPEGAVLILPEKKYTIIQINGDQDA